MYHFLAEGGTLFLNEIGEVPLTLQPKLLWVLQEQQFERVGEAPEGEPSPRSPGRRNR